MTLCGRVSASSVAGKEKPFAPLLALLLVTIQLHSLVAAFELLQVKVLHISEVLYNV